MEDVIIHWETDFGAYPVSHPASEKCLYCLIGAPEKNRAD